MVEKVMLLMIWVLLDEFFVIGMYEFVDLVNNGLWGEVLIIELILLLEK